MLRSAVAVIVGYMAMMVFVMAVTILSYNHLRAMHGQLTPGYLAFNAAMSLLAALLGGFVTGSIAAERRVRHGIILALVMMIMAALSYTHYKGTQPPWYQAMLVVVPSVVAVGGASVAARLAAERARRAKPA